MFYFNILNFSRVNVKTEDVKFKETIKNILDFLSKPRIRDFFVKFFLYFYKLFIYGNVLYSNSYNLNIHINPRLRIVKKTNYPDPT